MFLQLCFDGFLSGFEAPGDPQILYARMWTDLGIFLHKSSETQLFKNLCVCQCKNRRSYSPMFPLVASSQFPCSTPIHFQAERNNGKSHLKKASLKNIMLDLWVSVTGVGFCSPSWFNEGPAFPEDFNLEEQYDFYSQSEYTIGTAHFTCRCL